MFIFMSLSDYCVHHYFYGFISNFHNSHFAVL